jgi:hypothetical protein
MHQNREAPQRTEASLRLFALDFAAMVDGSASSLESSGMLGLDRFMFIGVLLGVMGYREFCTFR